MKEYGFYGWKQADVPAVNNEYGRVRDPRHLYDLLAEVWCADTCAPRMRDGWTRENMTLGQCSITAFLAQDIFGGEVRGIPRPDGNYHCYNVVGDCVFDLTSEQFGDEILSYEDNPVQSREVHFAKEEKRLRYEYLKAELRKKNEVWIPHRADPYVYRHHDGSYYFTATLPAYNGIALRRADTLDGLVQAREVMIWEKHGTGPMGAHVWAPELHYLWGKWYIYFAAGDAEDKWHIRPYVLECRGQDPMEDGWMEMGRLQGAQEDEFSFRSFSLDATVFEHGGQHYCVWAEKTGTGRMISNLYIARMESAVRLATAQELLTTPDYDWERQGFWVNEGPAVLKHDGRIFLTYSASDTSANYCMGMLTLDAGADPLDPGCWRKKRFPVLQSDEKKGIYGPGHNSFSTDGEGNPVIIFHARTQKQIEGDPLDDPNRHAMIRRVFWNMDGEPEFRL